MNTDIYNAKNIARNLRFPNNAECIPYEDAQNLTSEIGTGSPIQELPQLLRRMVWNARSTTAQDQSARQKALFPLQEVGEMSLHRLYLAIGVLLVACSLQAQTAVARPSASPGSPNVTAITGESWLMHLGRSFDNTSMGKTGRIGPGAEADGSPVPTSVAAVLSPRDEVALRGSDLYRMNCRGCHGEAGLGAPPEINSVINPVRATSVPLILARMKATGMDMSYADAAKLAQQSKAALLDRLQKGGESMPAFSHLSDQETRALLAYVMQLAEVPGYSNDGTLVRESRVRVGELIVRSTCHTCHSATGRDPGPEELMAGAIPPLSKLTARKNQTEFIRKVTSGAPVLMGAPPTLCRGRMPVFFYLSEEEAADVYLYLTLYPPSEQNTTSPLVAASLNNDPPSGNGPQSGVPVSGARNLVPEKEELSKAGWLQMAALPWLAVFVMFVLAGGLFFTFREFKRLSVASAVRAAAKASPTAEEVYNPGGGIGQELYPFRLSNAKRNSR